MPIRAGTSLGPYEILSPLGAGGMGEVYRARDTRLDRTVAIKILPESLASDPQFRDRFDREARTISQLEHPHICALYDVGRHDGTAYLVMQHLEGETLAERLGRGGLPRDQALTYAIQIADALSTAHRAGIIHRDLKPGNIMLTKSGAKLLDFGLAKVVAPAFSPESRASTPTTPAALTTMGTILGTFQYMSPEQLEGRESDARGDVWAFGCVLYEMLCGRPAFSGASAASLIANVLHAQPAPLPGDGAVAARALDHVIARCLEKDPDARWQAIADVSHELRWAAREHPAVEVAGRRSVRHRVIVWTAAGLLLAAAGAGLNRFLSPPPRVAAAPVLKLTQVAPRGLAFTAFGSNGIPHFALSPDGGRIAFVAAAAGRQPSLWVRALDSRIASEIAGSEDASEPFWSPDGQRVGFFGEGRLKTVALQGERPATLATIIDHAGAAWNGEEILVGRGTNSIVRVPAAGVAMTEATVLRPDKGGHRWPQFLPDGRHFIYTETRGAIMLAALDSRSATELVSTTSTAVYAPPGYLLFARPGATGLIAQPISTQTFRPSGPAKELLDEMRYAAGSGYPPVSASANGLLAYWDGTSVETVLQWSDRQGNPLTLPAPRDTHGFAISPSGRQVVFSREPSSTTSGRSEIWLMGEKGDAARFSVSNLGTWRPFWSADGRTVYFSSASGEQLALYRRAASGAHKEELIGEIPYIPQIGTRLAGNYFATDWTRDGGTAILNLTQPATGRDIVAFSVATRSLTPLVASPAFEVQARLSPDNRWLAYASNETGRWEIWVEPYPSSGGQRWQVSVDGGSQPIWRRDGSELFFLAPDSRLMATAVTGGAAFARDAPKPLFQTRMRATYAPYPWNYDVTADGNHFLIDGVRPDTGPNISMVVNWTAMLGAHDR